MSILLFYYVRERGIKNIILPPLFISLASQESTKGSKYRGQQNRKRHLAEVITTSKLNMIQQNGNGNEKRVTLRNCWQK